MPSTSPDESSKVQLLTSGLESLDSEVREIMTCLQEVLQSTGQAHLAEKLPWLTDENAEDAMAEPEQTSDY